MKIGRLKKIFRRDTPGVRDSVEERLQEIKTQLLLRRRWSYLRYVHLREGLIAAGPIDSFLAVGAGRGLAELALAVEFPDIQFRITDVVSERTPNYQAAQALAKQWALDNVEFGTLDVCQPIDERFDLIATTEVVEHIKDDQLAIEHMLAAANRFVFCLVPFADEKTLADPKKQARAWERHEHYRFGYSAERFHQLFDEVSVMRGCYWRDRGFVHRQQLGDLDDREIRSRASELIRGALTDIADELPKQLDEAQGIWVLARSPRATQEESDSEEVSTQETPASARKSDLGTQEGRLGEVRKRLVFYRSWSYLRYLHLREGLREAEEVSSVLSIGCGRGLSELALAIEFPEIRFHVTDIDSPTTSSAQTVIDLAKRWELDNISFGYRDILEPDSERFDLVSSVEVLEHLEDAQLAAANMVRAASRYVFCLVPFADLVADSDPKRRARAWDKDRHFRLGYAAAELRMLFSGPSIVRGCYWRDGAGPIPSKSQGPDDATLLTQAAQIQTAAQSDIRDQIPTRYPEALGIWILARPHEDEHLPEFS